MDAQECGPVPRRRRPRTLWILVLAAAISALGVIVTVAPVVSLTGAAPTTTFAAGDRATVTLDPAAEPRIYISADRPGRAECAVLDGPSPQGVSLRAAPEERGIEIDGVTWSPMFDVQVSEPGDYQVLCVYEGRATFGVGAPRGIGSSDAFRFTIFAAVGGMAAAIAGMARTRRDTRSD